MDLNREKRFNNPPKLPTHPEEEEEEESEQQHCDQTTISPHIFQTLLSLIESSSEDIQPPLLKCVYHLLIHLSLNLQCSAKYGVADFGDLYMEIGHYGIRVTFKQICRLSDILFNDLSNRFKLFFTALRNVSSIGGLEEAGSQWDIRADAEKLNLLLRCCLVILNLLVPQPYHLRENGKVLLSILRKLSLLCLVRTNEKGAICFVESISCECTYSDSDCTTFMEGFVASLCCLEPSNPNLSFLSAMLEVFVDELLVHNQLPAYFKLIDSVSPTSESLFVHRCNHGDTEILMEVICLHFCLSFSTEHACEKFTNKLFCHKVMDFRAQEVSQTAALSMFFNSFWLSAPKLLQAHIISLVSEAVDIGMGSRNLKLDLRPMDCCLSVFERSVILYRRHISSSQMDWHPTGSGGSFFKSNKWKDVPSFESYIQPGTRKKMNYLITKNSWHSYESNMSCTTKSDLITASMTYIKEDRSLLDISCRDEIILILSLIILRISSNVDDDSAPVANGDPNRQDLYLLVSILKLMGCSMLQVIWHLRNSSDGGGLKTLKNFSSCKEYDNILSIISCFRESILSSPIQKCFSDTMETQQMMHPKTKSMLLHFSDMLSLSFASGLGFVAKGCLLIMMAVLNLIVFEEGNLDSLKSLATGLPLVNVQEAVADNKSSRVASKFQKIQTIYLSPPSLAKHRTRIENGQAETSTSALVPDNMNQVLDLEEATGEEGNGEAFLKNILPRNSSDFNDLADFIECKPEKDYFGWLKDRERYRKWKCKKLAVLRWKQKKKTWKSIRVDENIIP